MHAATDRDGKDLKRVPRAALARQGPGGKPRQMMGNRHGTFVGVFRAMGEAVFHGFLGRLVNTAHRVAEVVLGEHVGENLQPRKQAFQLGGVGCGEV